ncbi:MAG TPA: diacylglycerol kinase family protein [Euzebyales bacterium]
MTTPPRRLVVAVNPAAASGRWTAACDRIVGRLRAGGHHVELLRAADWAALHAMAVAAVADGPRGRPDALVVVGGDGMVHLGVNVVPRTGVALGVVPTGSGNDTARALGLPRGDPDGAVDTLLVALDRGPTVADAGRATAADGSRTWFLGALSAGFDALVNERANHLRWPPGRSRYVRALLVELLWLRRIRYRLEIDGTRTDTDAALVCVANGPSIGGGMRVTPDALLDDALFDVLVVQPMSRAAFLRVFPSVYRGEHLRDPRVRVVRATRVRVDADGVVGYADGERVGPLPLDLELVPGAVALLAPPSAPALTGRH